MHRYQYSKPLNDIFISGKRQFVLNIDSNTFKYINDSSGDCGSLPEDYIPVTKKENSRHYIPQQLPYYPQHFEEYIQMQE